MKPIMPDIINQEQYAFIIGRNIQDSIISLQELAQTMFKSNGKYPSSYSRLTWKKPLTKYLGRPFIRGSLFSIFFKFSLTGFKLVLSLPNSPVSSMVLNLPFSLASKELGRVIPCLLTCLSLLLTF